MVNSKLDFYPSHWKLKLIHVISLLWSSFSQNLASKEINNFLLLGYVLCLHKKGTRNFVSDIGIKARSAQIWINYALDDEFTFLSSFWRTHVHKLSSRNRKRFLERQTLSFAMKHDYWKSYCCVCENKGHQYSFLSFVFIFKTVAKNWRRDKWYSV